MSRVLVISDLQAPFYHKDYLSFLLDVKKEYRCNKIVCVGDEIDAHSLGDYDHDPDGYSPGHELQAAINSLKPYYKAFPNVLLCQSNHTARIFKRAFKVGIPTRCLKDIRQIIESPKNWMWAYDWRIDGVRYLHGLGYYGAMGALNAAKDSHSSCVIGHLHADAGILFFNNGLKTIFGMNVGSGIDQKAYAFAYSKDSRKKAVVSCGVVIDGEPHLILMR